MNLYYIQTNIICLLILCIVAVMMQGKRENAPARRVAFLALVGCIGIICLSDIFAWTFNGKEGQVAYFIMTLSNIVYDSAISVAGYIWLCYVRLIVEGIEKYSRRFRLFAVIPLAIMLIAIFSTPATGLLFTIGRDNYYVRGNGVIFHWIVSWGYLIYAGILVVNAIRRSESLIEKRQLKPLLWFIVPPAAAAVVQMIFYGVTTMQCGMTLSALIIALSTMQLKVSTDSLTDLNNRTAFENYINERVLHLDNRFALMMCDVDKFKTINDNLGHIVGDIVLKRMASILKSVCAESKQPLFLCRYGGDEFVICSTEASLEEIEQIKASIDRRLEALNKEYPSEILLGMSIGCAEGICRNARDIEALIGRADELMYEQKRIKELED